MTPALQTPFTKESAMPTDPKSTKPTDETPEDKKTETKNDEKEKTEGEKDGEGDDEKEESPADLKAKLKSLELRNKELQEENTKRRLENKRLKEDGDGETKKKKDSETIESVKAEANRKLKNALVRSELASVAHDAHDMDIVRAALGKTLDDVDVDLDDESVDRGELEKKVAKLREAKPFLFKAAKETGDEKPRKGAPLSQGTRPSGNKNEAAHWKLLKDQGRVDEARDYYQKNRATIMAQLS